MKLSKDDLLKAVTEYIGDKSDDDSLTLLENVTDTVNDYEERVADQTDWKQKYEDNDADWRQRYKDRFSDPDAQPPAGPTHQSEYKALTFDALFETE